MRQKGAEAQVMRDVQIACHIDPLPRVIHSEAVLMDRRRKERQMQPRMKSPALSVPGVIEAMQALSQAATDAAEAAGVPRSTIELVHLRASR
jgi:hypothetical protein